MELLFVTAILAVLVGFLFPVFAAVRDRGRGACCVSNMRQLGLALAIYADAYDGRLPASGDFRYPATPQWVFCQQQGVLDAGYGVLAPFVRSVSIFPCPSSALPLAYSMNHQLSEGVRDLVSFPAETVLLVEEGEHVESGTRFPNDACLHAEYATDWLTSRHQGGGHVLWSDGHVRWMHASRRWDVRQFAPLREMP